ncbi:unnamed protein product [Closterium sp. NIES-64]|nr:unnamed protein product [Closterium sp. NIES-64]
MLRCYLRYALPSPSFRLPSLPFSVFVSGKSGPRRDRVTWIHMDKIFHSHPGRRGGPTNYTMTPFGLFLTWLVFPSSIVLARFLRLFPSNKLDPGGVSNYTVTFVDWTERKWHPKAYSVDNTTSLLLRQIKCEDRYIAWRPYWHRIRQSYKSHLVRGLPRFDGCCGAVRC